MYNLWKHERGRQILSEQEDGSYFRNKWTDETASLKMVCQPVQLISEINREIWNDSPASKNDNVISMRNQSTEAIGDQNKTMQKHDTVWFTFDG